MKSNPLKLAEAVFLTELFCTIKHDECHNIIIGKSADDLLANKYLLLASFNTTRPYGLKSKNKNFLLYSVFKKFGNPL